MPVVVQAEDVPAQGMDLPALMQAHGTAQETWTLLADVEAVQVPLTPHLCMLR